MKNFILFITVLALSSLFCSIVVADTVDTQPGNTPVVDIPSDYYPENSGFWFTIPEGKDAGKKMFFRDSIHNGSNPQITVVLVHGNPESSYTYRKVIDNLIQSSGKPLRIIAMDHIGFGLSDQASYEMVSMDHAENLLQLIQYLDINNATLVVHDWGGPIGIGAFLQEHETVSNLVVLNTTVFPMPDEGYTYNNFPLKLLPWARIPWIMPDGLWGSYASYALFMTRSNVWSTTMELMSYVLLAENGIFPEEDKDARKLFRDQFQSKSNVRMSKRMVLQSGHWGHGNWFLDPKLGWRDTTAFYRTIQDEITMKWGTAGSNIGVRAVLGRWDPLGKDEVIAQWTENLPQLEGHVNVFEDIGHFIEEFKYVEISEAIIEVSGLE